MLVTSFFLLTWIGCRASGTLGRPTEQKEVFCSLCPLWLPGFLVPFSRVSLFGPFVGPSLVLSWRAFLTTQRLLVHGGSIAAVHASDPPPTRLMLWLPRFFPTSPSVDLFATVGLLGRLGRFGCPSHPWPSCHRVIPSLDAYAHQQTRAPNSDGRHEKNNP